MSLPRCAAHMHLNCYNEALEDAKDCVRYCPNWDKGWARLGSVLYRLDRMEESLQAYEKGELILFRPLLCYKCGSYCSRYLQLSV